MVAAMRKLLTRHSRDWSRKGVYAYWDPDTRELLYIGLASNLPQRFAEHNGLVRHSGGNKRQEINKWFSEHENLGHTLLIQGAAVQILEDVRAMNPMIGVEARALTQVAEGQLLKLSTMETGSLPPWNNISGAVRGGEWARPSERSPLRLLSAAEESLFVSRRSLRALVHDRRALQLEALMHAVRMQALMEIHGMNFDHNNHGADFIERMTRVLMLIEGKLVDDLDVSDSTICDWLVRFAKPSDMASRRSQGLLGLDSMADASNADDRDRATARFLTEFMQLDADAYNARVARDILDSGYLDERPL